MTYIYIYATVPEHSPMGSARGTPKVEFISQMEKRKRIVKSPNKIKKAENTE